MGAKLALKEAPLVFLLFLQGFGVPVFKTMISRHQHIVQQKTTIIEIRCKRQVFQTNVLACPREAGHNAYQVHLRVLF